MARSKSEPVASENRLFVLALGLLVGFAMAFVLFLSRLPVDELIHRAGGASGEELVSAMSFDYPAVLQAQQAARKSEPVRATTTSPEPPVVFMEPPSTLGNADAGLALQQIQQPQSAQQSTLSADQSHEQQARSQTDVTPSIVTSDTLRQRVLEVPASTAGQESYYVEAGNYQANADALQVQSLLRSVGLDAFIVVRQDSRGGYGHRVRIGPFVSQSRLDATRATLRASGLTPKVIRVRG